MRAFRIAGMITVGLLVLAVIGVVALATLLESGFFTPRILAYANERLEQAGGLHLTTASLYWRPWSGLNIEDARLALRESPAEPDSAASAPPTTGFAAAPHRVLAAVDAVEVGYRLGDLLVGRPRIQKVKVLRPDVDLAAISRWRERVTRGADPSENTESGGFRLGGFVVEDLRIVRGRVEREAGVLFSDLDLTGSLHGASGHWSLAVEEAATQVAVGEVDEFVELTGNVSFTGDAIGLDGLHFKAGGGRISFQGRIEPVGWKTRILTTGYAIPLERIGSWVQFEHPLLTGNLEFRFLTKGTIDSLDVNGGLRGVAEDGTGRDVVFSLSRKGSEFRVDSVRLETGDSRVDVSAQLVLGDKPRVDGVATFRTLDPALLLAEEDLARVTDLDGTVRFEGTGLSRETFEGAVELEMTAGSAFGFSIDAASVSLSASKGNLILHGARLTRGESAVSGVGTIDAHNNVVAEFSGTVDDLGDLFAASPSDSVVGPVTGQASADVRIIGPLAGPSLEALLHFEDTSVLGAGAAALDLSITSETLGNGAELAITATGRNIGYDGKKIPRGTASGVWNGSAFEVRTLSLESSRRGELRLTGNLTIGNDGGVAGRVSQLDVRSREGDVTWTNQGSVSIDKQQGTLEFTGLDLRSATGSVTGNLSIQSSGEAAIVARGSDVDLAVFSPFLLLEKDLGGLLQFEVDAVVGADTLAANLEIDLVDGQYGDESLERIAGRVTIRNDRVLLEDVSLRSSFATADIDGAVKLTEGAFSSAFADSTARRALLTNLRFEGLDVDIDAPDFDRVREAIPQIPSPGGALRLTATVDGAATIPKATFTVSIDDAQLAGEPIDHFQARGSFDGSVLLLEESRLESGEGSLEAVGEIPLAWGGDYRTPKFQKDRDADLRLRSQRFPVRCLAVLVPFCELLEGPATADVRLVGAGGHMWFEGDFELDGTVLTIPGLEDPLVDGRVQGRLDSSGLEFVSLRFSDGRNGEAVGTGRLELDDLSLRDLAFDLEARQWRYRSRLGIQGVGDGRLFISRRELRDGTPVPYLEGRFDVTRADLEEKLLIPREAGTIGDLPPGVNVPEDAVTGPDGNGVEPELALVLAKLAFVAKNNIWLTTKQAKIEMTGDVTFHSTEDYVGITGEVKTLQGQYAVLNTEFDVEKGEIEFTDPKDPQSSYVNAVATTRVLDEDVTVHVSGTLGDPLIEVSTASDMTEEEIYEFLALRRLSGADVNSDEGLVGRDLVASWGALVATRFGRELSSELGLDTFEVGGEADHTTVGLGKRLGSTVFVKYTQQVSTGEVDPAAVESRNETPERQILLQYRLSEIFQLHGETGTIKGDEYVNIDVRAEWGY